MVVNQPKRDPKIRSRQTRMGLSQRHGAISFQLDNCCRCITSPASRVHMSLLSAEASPRSFLQQGRFYTVKAECAYSSTTAMCALALPHISLGTNLGSTWREVRNRPTDSR